jgi:hypothetical protein
VNWSVRSGGNNFIPTAVKSFEVDLTKQCFKFLLYFDKTSILVIKYQLLAINLLALEQSLVVALVKVTNA